MTKLQNMDNGASNPEQQKAWPAIKRFFHLVGSEYRRHDLLNMASSLSYTTLLSLVPVFAIVLGIVGSIRGGMYTEIFITTLKNQVPTVAGMGSLIDAVREIAGSARAIVGLGVVTFAATGFFLFLTIVRDFNRIWSVEKSRSILARLSGFITAIILVPLLMILSIYVNLYVARTVDSLETAVARRSVFDLPEVYNRQSQVRDIETAPVPGEAADEEDLAPGSPKPYSGEDHPATPRGRLRYDSENPDEVTREIEDYRSGKLAVKVALQATSLLLSILAMSALYFLLPNRRVKWWAALSGGLIAGVFLELGNYLFRIYAGMSSTVLLKIYGTLLAVPLGLGWLWILWVIVLLGSVVGYVVQHYRELSEQAELENRDLDKDLYIALLLTAETAERFRQGRSTSGMIEDLSSQTGFSGWLIRGILARLLDKGVLASVEGKPEEYVPGRSIASLTLDQVVFPILGNVFTVSSGMFTENEKSRKIMRVLESAGFALKNSLERTSLDELVEGDEGQAE